MSLRSCLNNRLRELSKTISFSANMSKALTIPESALALFGLFYYSYFIDPFTRKPKRRNSYRLLTDDRYRRLQLALSAGLVAAAIVYALISGRPDCISFSVLPIFFIGLMQYADWIILRRTQQHFELIITGDAWGKSPWLRLMLSYLVFIGPFTSILLLVFLEHYSQTH